MEMTDYYDKSRGDPITRSTTTEDQEKPKNIVEEKVIDGNEAFNQAVILEPPRAFSRVSVVLYLCCLLGFLCSTMNGYDASLFNALTINHQFLEYFNGKATGPWQALVSAMYQIGGVASLPFVGPALDTYGRRVGMFIGAIIVVFGTIIQGLTTGNASTGQFMAGRVLLGFGVNIASAAGPMYVVEVSHPAHRGVVTALYNTFWFTGAIVASSAARGADNLTGTISWAIPVWLQLLFSGIIVIMVFLLPESPRWLYVNRKFDAAKRMLTKYHGEGNPDSIWVTLQLREYEEYLEMNGSDKRWWDYSALFRTRASRYRLFCNVMISIFGQWAGNSVLSYFLSAVLDTAGVEGTIRKANLNLANNFQQFFFAVVGAVLVDRVGRRPLLIFGNVGCCLVWAGMCIASGIYQGSKEANKAAADVMLFFIFLFGSIYSIGFTPLQALFPVEVLSFEMRAKGMAFSGLAVNMANLLNQFAWPIALEDIGWKTYIVFCIWCAVQATCVYFFIPETKNRTLEELDEIFSSPTPVKTSIEKKKVALAANGEIVNVERV
ncbi:hypothetical protein V498_02700 [Pseudogymnoascus sp. VKM F-4517 (FW-2822)]|nr:hypothetical protein V498_02700 [Pseudogymnoascus sp. VKM F-4517 (FW-2822)]